MDFLTEWFWFFLFLPLAALSGWIIGRRASSVAVCAAVASALATHFATRPEMEIDIQVG